MVQQQNLLLVEGVGIVLNAVNSYDLGLFVFHFVAPFKMLPRTGGSVPLFLLRAGCG
jgi:hypothetical protein